MHGTITYTAQSTSFSHSSLSFSLSLCPMHYSNNTCYTYFSLIPFRCAEVGSLTYSLDFLLAHINNQSPCTQMQHLDVHASTTF